MDRGAVFGVIRDFSSFGVLSAFWSLLLFSKMDEVFFCGAIFGGCPERSFYFKIDTPFEKLLSR